MNRLRALLACLLLMVFPLLVSSCGSSSGTTRVTYGMGVGYGGYYGRSPYYGYHDRPIYIGGGGIPDIPQGPVAAPLPSFGMPDMGGMDTMDMGGFDF